MAKKGARQGQGKEPNGWDATTTTIAIDRSDASLLEAIKTPEDGAVRRVIHRLIIEHVLHARVAKVVYEGIPEPEPVVFRQEVTPEEAKALEEFLKARREGTTTTRQDATAEA